jgi:starch synthase
MITDPMPDPANVADRTLRVLHAASECFPLAKTGGLGDVVGALPAALRTLGIDARVALPGYPGLRELLEPVERVARYSAGGADFEIFRSRLGEVPVYLFDSPALFDRQGGLYEDAARHPWQDNALRFGAFGLAAAQFALRGVDAFRPDVVHLHDWQAALAAPAIAQVNPRPRLVFTIHNLAYQGLFDRRDFNALALPGAWWNSEGVEFWNGFSFMKAGLNFADAITTVSPTYAREITTPAFGNGLDGVLRRHVSRLSGIVNGIDEAVWNPATDPLLTATYTAATVEGGKRTNKVVLQMDWGLATGDFPLIGFIGRLADQKGADLILAAGDQLLAETEAQFAILASGDPALQRAFSAWAERAPGRVAVRMVHDEKLAHRLTAAADLLLMPSRFEPCGLNQLYAQRYGTIPVVHRTGGLADTVTDTTEATLANGTATGVHFADADAGGVAWGVQRGLQLLADRTTRTQLQATGMARDFSWPASAQQHQQLYQALLRA